MSNAKSSVKLSDTYIERLKTPAKRRFVTDLGCTGLQLSVTPKGQKSFYYRFPAGNHSKRKWLGEHPHCSLKAARKAVNARQVKRLAGVAHVEAPKVETFKMAFYEWLKCVKSEGKKTWSEDERKFDVYLPLFHDKPLVDFTNAFGRDLKVALGEKHGKIMSNRTLSMVKSVLNFACDEDEKDFVYSGAMKVKKYDEASRKVTMTIAEEERFYDAVVDVGSVHLDCFLMARETWCRISNVREARWSNVDLETGIWSIPGTETKSGNDLTAFLCDAEFKKMTLLNMLRARNVNANPRYDWIFPSPQNPRVPLRHVHTRWTKLMESLGMPRIHIHDLRRTGATRAIENGFITPIIAVGLGHRVCDSGTSVYVVPSNDAVRVAVCSTMYMS